MARNLLQDMVKVKTPQRLIKQKSTDDIEIFFDKNKEKEIVFNKINKNNKKSKYRFYFIAFISVVFLLFALSFLFSGAKITISPKIKEISINENLSAIKNLNTSGLSFDLVVVSGEEDKTIQGGEEKEVAVVARGTVILYNSFSSLSQTLDVDTRLEGSNGKIYKTSKKIKIPGMIKDKPGSIKVDIYASEVGEEYNSTPIDFKIFGFKGTEKYSKFYARSEGNIIGGFIGKTPVVSSLDKVNIVSELKVALEEKLLKKAMDQIPSGFILFKDAAVLEIDDKNISFTTNEDNMVSVNVKGTLYGFLFSEDKIIKKIAEGVIDEYDGGEVYIPNIRDLVFSLDNSKDIEFTDVKNISFNLKGIPKIIWKIDETKFISDILNKNKKDFNKILLQYSSIDSAELVIRPFWKSSFPEKSKSIELIVNYPK
ncbi:MAG: hypothetical protein UR25_C0001G0091 [Candidatus Nomurabacteria bacterium GW2011_GWE1_32_28]|uniref:Baseplate protein J-like domain-containing protein n=1 Tax=Candidatus Nomurabacteria bacterium GW2011_GWF1_31_48 TaxID=1618767 RepID=A0A0G0AVK6_9BACT|nr:MAG: hypothetical protein UR10_C0001G0044 [Candidatus Nomurabacteria bacterium GW2011_GWF2_30_133]KKP28922.1 MAG: hypothetical protein UR18_C0001G0043 [Candidatus Nomurabacteria bacterium GW2011_GWE2_31_40]KKP30660.1 MAG: hypothetical protein UR19_C0001G0044 [Candidatus Nomurabacteria bacterium GW2011_GWF1_31_48]KKP35178.1 MAG: hypothetical protein UR25_C0001G0091 [Candidatus Nomurabacteria bacterium GW2011_GWE1_32_28]HAS80487.1 hypothetical protein [Candidatus Nomurabacteria bacterium]